MAFPDTPILDSGVSSNSNPLAGGWAQVPFWNAAPLHQIVSNTIQPGTGGFPDALWNRIYNADQQSFLTYNNIGTGLTSLGLYCRMTNANSPTFNNQYFYIGVTTATGALLLNVNDGTETTIGTGTLSGGAVANGDSLGLSCSGSDIIVWFKRAAGSWTNVLQVTETRQNVAGRIGFNTDWAGGTPYQITNFGGGDIPSSLMQPGKGGFFAS